MATRSGDSKLRKDQLPVAPLPQRAVYALRAMAVLANLAPGESIPGRELAERAAIPAAFVSKVMRRLVEGGLVESRRGHGGGFRLAVAPAGVTFGAILDAVDCPLDTQLCVFGFCACDAADPCALHDAWSELRTALSDWADGTTLASARPASRSTSRADRDPHPA